MQNNLNTVTKSKHKVIIELETTSITNLLKIQTIKIKVLILLARQGHKRCHITTLHKETNS